MSVSKLQKKYLISKQNTLNEMRSIGMSLQELRLFSIYLSKINPRDKNTRLVRFYLEDFKKIMALGRLNMSHLTQTTDRLLCQIINIPNERGGYTGFQFFKECTVDVDERGEWYVEIDAHDKALPLIFEFKGNYFKYELWNTLRLKSKNQLRMYEILKQYEKLGKRIISINNLRHMLGIDENDYPQYKHFKQNVLEVCKKALSENTDISYTYEPHGKKGRGGKILELKFVITKNQDFQDPLRLDEFLEINKGNMDGGESASDEIDFSDIDENGNVRATGRHWMYEERITYLMTACSGEFTRDELVVLYNEMRVSAPHVYQNEHNAHDYLQLKYNEMNMRKPSSSRFGYLKKMIASDKQ